MCAWLNMGPVALKKREGGKEGGKERAKEKARGKYGFLCSNYTNTNLGNIIDMVLSLVLAGMA